MRQRHGWRPFLALGVAILLPAAARAAGPPRPAGAAQADLEVSVTATPDPVLQGAPISYTLTVTNHGPDPSPQTDASALLDVAQFLSASPPCQPLNPSFVVCPLGTLDVGATVSVTVEFLVNTSVPLVHNNAHVQGSAADPEPANNHVFHTTTVSGTPRYRLGLAHGVRVAGSLLAAEGAVGDFYRLRQEPYSSHEVTVDAASGDIAGPGGPLLDRLASDAQTVLQSGEAVGAGPARSMRFTNASASTIDDQQVRLRSADWLHVGSANDVYHLRFFDTTYAIPRFNNGGGQRTVLLVQNPTTRAVTLRAWFWSASGALLATYEPALLAPHGVLAVDTSTLPGLSGAAGAITVASDAPYGVLAGKAVSVEASTGFTFDTRMEPRIR